MRFALIATSAVAAVAVPFAVSAAGPQMSGEQFLSAVRCAAYEDVMRPGAELGLVKMRLNVEARHQPQQTAAQAEAEVSAIVRQAVHTAGGASLRQQRDSACSGAGTIATGASAVGEI